MLDLQMKSFYGFVIKEVEVVVRSISQYIGGCAVFQMMSLN